MNTSSSPSSPMIDSLSDGVQHLRLVSDTAKFMTSPLLMTPPPSDDSAKSQKSTSNHSEHDNKNPTSNVAYLDSLKEERDQLALFSDGALRHVFTLIEKEIKRVGDCGEAAPTSSSGSPPTMLSEIIMVPVQQYPDYNFVGRILGPRGTTAKQLEATTGCRVTILGRNKKETNGSSTAAAPPADNGPLRVQVSVSSDAPQAALRMEAGINVVKALLIPPADGQDELKRQQLLILATLNGTYRPRTTGTPEATTLHVNTTTGCGSGDYGNQFQNLLPYGYRLPGKSGLLGNTTNASASASTKLDCFNPKCAILRGLIEQHSHNNNIPKMEDVLSVMHMYELMNRIRLANSSLFGRKEEHSKAQEIGNRMCSSIGTRRNSVSSSTATSSSPFNAPGAPGAAPTSSSPSGPTRRLYNAHKLRPQFSSAASNNNNQTAS